jgi:hypothetical protein
LNSCNCDKNNGFTEIGDFEIKDKGRKEGRLKGRKK